VVVFALKPGADRPVPHVRIGKLGRPGAYALATPARATVEENRSPARLYFRVYSHHSRRGGSM